MTADPQAAAPHLAQVLDAHGLALASPLEPGELVMEALVIVKVLTIDGKVEVRWGTTTAMDWTARRALLEIMRDRERFTPGRGGDDD